jgi:hypothetical protein
VLHSWKGPEALGDCLVGDPRRAGGGRRRRCVLAVVRTRDAWLGRERIVARERGPGQVEPAGNDRRLRALEDPELRIAVGVEGPVPVEVIGLEVEQDRDPRPKLVDVLELEAGHLTDDGLTRVDQAVELAERPPDVAGDRRAEHEAEKLRGRRLAVGPGNRDEGALVQQTGTELDLAPDRNAAPARLDDERCCAGDTRALDEKANAAEQGEVGVVSVLAIGADDLDPAPFERRARGSTRAGQPEHEHAVGQHGQRAKPVK